MTLIQLLLFIVIVGVLMWLVNTYIPMPHAIKSLLNVIVLLLLIVWVLQFFGLIPVILPFPNWFKW